MPSLVTGVRSGEIRRSLRLQHLHVGQQGLQGLGLSDDEVLYRLGSEAALVSCP